MNIKIYGAEYIDEKSKPIYESLESFNLVKRSDKLLKNLVKSVGTEYKFSIDDTMFNLADLFVLKVNVNLVGDIYFVFNQMEDKNPLIDEITKLKELNSETLEEKATKVKALFEVSNKFSPLLVVVPTFVSCVTKELVNEGSCLLMKNDPNDPKEVKDRDFKDKLVDRLFSAIIPVFLVLFAYLICNYFTKNSSVPAVLLVIGTLVASGLLGYGFFYIYKERKGYKENSNYLNILYLLNFVGLIVGLGGSYLVGLFVVKEEDKNNLIKLMLIGLIIAILLLILVHIVSSILAKKIQTKKSIEEIANQEPVVEEVKEESATLEEPQPEPEKEPESAVEEPVVKEKKKQKAPKEPRVIAEKKKAEKPIVVKPKKEKKVKPVKPKVKIKITGGMIVDGLFSSVLPIFFVAFGYLFMSYLGKGGLLSAILLVVGVVVALAIFSYGTLLIYKDNPFKEHRLYIILTWILNVIGLALGVGVCYLLAMTILKEESVSLITSYTLFSLGFSILLIIGDHLIVSALSKVVKFKKKK